jgi:anaerobic selenocysteine-containing dehydrogenase
VIFVGGWESYAGRKNDFQKSLLVSSGKDPEMAAKLDIKDGSFVRVTSPRGAIKCAASLTDLIDPRVVHLYYGFKEGNCNVLTDDEACGPITGSTGLKSLLCIVEKT